MLFLLVKFLYIIILSFLYGYTLQQFLHNRILKNIPAQPHFSLITLNGFFAITVIASGLSIFMPLAGLAHGIILVAGLLCYMFQRTAIHKQVSDYAAEARSAGRSRQLLAGAAIIYVLYLSAQQPFTYDEGLYYAQFIKWMQHYKAVPGLANLHERFGYNSHWHVLSAVFNFSWLNGIADNRLNGVLYLLTVLYLLPRKQDANFIALLKAGLLVMINMPQFGAYYIIAPAADTAIYYISCLVIVSWLEKSAAGTPPLQSNNGVFMLLAPIFLLTVKVSSIPILVLTVLMYWQVLRQKNYAQLLILCGIGIVILAPWLVRNVIFSGYLLFPMEMPDLFHTGWAVPTSVIRSTRLDITVFAIYRVADIPRYFSESTLQQFSTWFLHSLRIYDKALVLATMASPILVFIRRKQLPAGFVPLYVFLLLGCCFWLKQAPDPRFGYSYLAPLVILTALFCFPKLQLRQVYIPVLCVTLLFQAGTLALRYHLHKVFVQEKMIAAAPPTGTLLMPVPYAPTEIIQHNAAFPVNTTPNGLCWTAPLPCADHLPNGVKRRGSSLGDGFAPEE
ncbi:hypothetical protein [Chitinophaga sp. CF418]|uniref:LIC_10190 family membrane protein n=1 Tax=Chitinophaga sp. CF418 TaxID=1855287 RepID=UPI00091C6B2B|nr:hypothetical protein [Chitinophaga sp. CF418]SHM21686.1 hypothetical protein SAMN05216311_101877 [Chitinophaga sp. CF418]